MKRDYSGKTPFFQDRNERIYKDYLINWAIPDLAQRYWLSEAHVYRIIATVKKKEAKSATK